MRVVVVGGGVGGLACAKRLAKRDGGIEVRLVDRALRHDFAPSFLWLLTGERRRSACRDRWRRSVAPASSSPRPTVTRIDLAAGKLGTSAGEIGFEELVLAPGAALAPESVPRLSEVAHGFYTREDATRLRDALVSFQGGRVLVVVAAMPFKCPAAPYEAAFLIDELLRRRGVTAQGDIVTVEPRPLPVAGEQIGAQVAQMLAQRRIGSLAACSSCATRGFEMPRTSPTCAWVEPCERRKTTACRRSGSLRRSCIAASNSSRSSVRSRGSIMRSLHCGTTWSTSWRRALSFHASRWAARNSQPRHSRSRSRWKRRNCSQASAQASSRSSGRSLRVSSGLNAA